MSTLATVFLILGFICFGIMDKLAHHFESINIKAIRSNPNYWKKDVSWVNKYKNKNKDNLFIPAFFGSTSFLVFLTDGWHLIQWFAYTFIILGVIFITNPTSIIEMLFHFIILRFLLTSFKYLTMKYL
jgi:hypothetical protein